jgi:hypothetical protein
MTVADNQYFAVDSYSIKEGKIEAARVLETNLRAGLLLRSQYGYCTLHAAGLASRLGLAKISILELGVAGGNGLISLEYWKSVIEEYINIEIEIYGFDTGSGLPELVDYRDVMYNWAAGDFRMDISELEKRLKSATLVLGDVQLTTKDFFDIYRPAPVGAIMHDLDMYSSTINSFNLFSSGSESFLPRVFNYFDDIVGNENSLYNDFTGERLAIREFNENTKNMKFSPAYHLIHGENPKSWHNQIYILHNFQNTLYNSYPNFTHQDIPLSE